MSVSGLTVPLVRADEWAAINRFGKAPRTRAVPTLPIGSTEDAWKRARHKGCGASEMAVLLDVSPYNSRFALWWQKFNGWDIEGTDAMHIGTVLEPAIGQLFGERFKDALLFRPGAALWAHPDYPWMLCTPDFLAVFPDDPTRVIPVECKSDQTSIGWGKTGTDEVPLHHAIQARCQAHIFGSPLAYVAHLHGKNFSVHPLQVTDAETVEYQGFWVPEARKFLASLEAGLPPEVDGHEATTTALEKLYATTDPELPAVVISAALAETYRRIGRELSRLRGEYREVSNRVRYEIAHGTHAVDADGRGVAKRVRYTRSAYEVPPSPVDKLVPDRRGRHGTND